jgi:quinol monooxygenase YgiN
MITHIVMWKLKKPGDAAQFKGLLESCHDLVPGMERFEVAIRTPQLEANCDVVLYSEFSNAAALAAYQNHPEHNQISAVLGKLRETRSVLDYEL